MPKVRGFFKGIAVSRGLNKLLSEDLESFCCCLKCDHKSKNAESVQCGTFQLSGNIAFLVSGVYVKSQLVYLSRKSVDRL